MIFSHWPTPNKTITQAFGANPNYYEQFGLPGHEGIDIRCYLGEPYFAAADGEVVWASQYRRSAPDVESNYGFHVILDHENGYTSLYAHAVGDLPVILGQAVKGGQIVGFSGNTGNSSGPHLHFTVKKEGAQLAGWPPGYVDPLPLLEHLL